MQISRVLWMASWLALIPSLGGTAASPPPRARQAKKALVRMAFTIDDLPATAALPDGWTKARVLEQIVQVLRAHRVPEPVGFLTGSNMDADPATRAALQSWLSAGFVLGNHTFAHDSVYELGWLRFSQDVERNRTVIADLVGGGHVSPFFRYPYLERGRGIDERRVRHYLNNHAYRVADVSVDFEDWAFSAAYVRCTMRGDSAALTALSASYLDVAMAELFWATHALRRLSGRSVPQVLLVHANYMTAQMLDALLTSYERAGVQFVPLPQVLRDEGYLHAQGDRHGDASLVEALMRERHAHLREFVPVPLRLLEVLCP
jgi:peptidoglycan/xylan/chitin deacetylase (PgdA/CDA1 family)